MWAKPNTKYPISQKNSFGNEVLKDSSSNYAPKFSLKGVLGLNQTVEIHQNPEKPKFNSEVLFGQTSYLEREQQALSQSRQKELEKKIDELRTEIKLLLKATDNLDKQVEVAALQPSVEPSEYQINFFARIKQIIANFRKNISETSLWLESFSHKKKKRNLYWNTVKNKKSGGEQYLMSNEHSVARSVG